MREIKFRGYAVEEMCDGQWVYGTGIHRTIFSDEYAAETGEKGEWFIFTERGFVKVHKESIGQFTGLHDKHGLEIYEGDVLLFNNSHNDRNNKWKCVVKYREGSFVCEYPVDGVYNHFDSWNVPKVTWEIIGSIYENSDLLEEQ